MPVNNGGREGGRNRGREGGQTTLVSDLPPLAHSCPVSDEEASTMPIGENCEVALTLGGGREGGRGGGGEGGRGGEREGGRGGEREGGEGARLRADSLRRGYPPAATC